MGEEMKMVIIATPAELRFSCAADIIFGLTKPPAGLSNAEYREHLLNVFNIAGQLQMLLEQDEVQIAKRIKKLDEKRERAISQKKRVKSDQTAVMKLKDLTAPSDDHRIKKELMTLENSIKPRLLCCLASMKDILRCLEENSIKKREMKRKQQAVSDVFKWIQSEKNLLDGTTETITISP